MNKVLKKILLQICLSNLAWGVIHCQCSPSFDPPLSQRLANYTIQLRFDHVKHLVEARERIQFINPSPDTISELRFYMYLNAFKNSESTFLKGSDFPSFGIDMSKRTEKEWGWIRIEHAFQNGNDIVNQTKYIQPDDGNPEDQTVLSMPLLSPVLPGDSLILELEFSAKLPKTFVRHGYSKDDFNLWVHWFPQLGVYELRPGSGWGWNCHQFFRNTEFYAEFGVYDVEITFADHFVIGASGCKINERMNANGTRTVRYRAEDVIDFAWVAYPHFEVVTDQWEHVQIKLLIPPEHCALSSRYLIAIKQSLSYLTQHVGPYPFPTITIVDPPLHALRSGMMEYPTFITGASCFGIPSNIRSLESLVIHEFTHQYFMMMLASNEKEEAWLDEGFVTYFEDKILDHYYGEKESYYNIMGYKSGNKELSRLEYAGMTNHRIGVIASPGWEVTEGGKNLFYSKTATMLQTMEGLVGNEVMESIIKEYFEKWKFNHPRGPDFIHVANEVIRRELGDRFGKNMNWFFDQCLYQTAVCDYAAAEIINTEITSKYGLFDDSEEKPDERSIDSKRYLSRAKLYRLGDMIIPVDVLFTFEDGAQKLENWNGEEYLKYYEFSTDYRLVRVHIDPEQKIYLDIDLNNNSKTLKPAKWSIYKLSLKSISWVQNVLQTASFLF